MRRFLINVAIIAVIFAGLAVYQLSQFPSNWVGPSPAQSPAPVRISSEQWQRDLLGGGPSIRERKRQAELEHRTAVRRWRDARASAAGERHSYHFTIQCVSAPFFITSALILLLAWRRSRRGFWRWAQWTGIFMCCGMTVWTFLLGDAIGFDEVGVMWIVSPLALAGIFVISIRGLATPMHSNRQGVVAMENDVSLNSVA